MAEYRGWAQRRTPANALLALTDLGDSSHKKTCERAAEWIIRHRRNTGGWAWCEDSWNFTEPTSLAILALTSSGYSLGDELVDFIAKFQCDDGGWNSHAPKLLGIPQASTPSVTAWALIAMGRLGLGAPILLCQKRLTTCTGIFRLTGPTRPTHWLFVYALSWCTMKANCSRRWYVGWLGLQGDEGAWKSNILWTAMAGISLREYISKV